MNTSFKFLIPTIFITLGFITSCNDDIAGEEEPDGNNNTPPATVASTPPISNPPPPTTTNKEENSDTNKEENPDFDINNIDPEDLSRKIQKIEETIKKLEQENTKHFDEYYKLSDIQKEILEEMKRKKMIMRSKPVGSEEQAKAQKDFEDQKKLGKEKLEVIKEKNTILHNLSKSLTKAREEKSVLQKQQKYFLKKQKEQKEQKEQKNN
ncbi:hypothetical protein [Blattabacterium sp. (Nauphoeta cinerea)]|uniref:hypothetical protein n=1 Tax=Blattabacterium sp. (Nauphoeta cinerea) TaxID=1316444 RepID=UPI00040E17EF|nr:hypothetical protein [Blattabacterium sp. (Nauphoeta cinerea)]